MFGKLVEGIIPSSDLYSFPRPTPLFSSHPRNKAVIISHGLALQLPDSPQQDWILGMLSFDVFDQHLL